MKKSGRKHFTQWEKKRNKETERKKMRKLQLTKMKDNGVGHFIIVYGR